MPLRIYRISAANTVSSVGVGATTIVNKGRIKQAVLLQNGIGGAGEGRLSCEIALNNTANGNAETATGAPSEFLIARTGAQFGNGTTANQSTVVPVDIAVMPGNVLCLNFVGVGTAPARSFVYADIYVKE